MTNINCISTCVYQKDGKCCLDNTSLQPINLTSNCIYFKNIETVVKD